MLENIVRLAAIAALATGLAFISLASAQEPAPAEEPVAAGHGFYFTPRVWVAKVSTAQSSYQGATINETIVPMYGGSLTWAPPGWGATGFSVTGFFGTGSDSFYERTHVASNLDGNREIDRLDIQALVQMPLGSHGTWSTGLRYVNFYSHAKGADAYTGTPFEFKDRVSLYLAELGFLSTTPVGERGSYFGGITGGIGYRMGDSDSTCCGLVTSRNTKNAVVGSLDMNAGFGYELSSAATFSFRWRMFLLSETIKKGTGDDTGLELGIVHGPEFNLVWKFN